VVLAVTGLGQPLDWVLTKASGIDHHLVKPVDPAVLRRTLYQLVPLG
jgi:two-component system OmpR family response regulator